MDSLNLALVFAPTLFLASKSVCIFYCYNNVMLYVLCIAQELRSAASLSSLSSLLKFMIENMEEIFEVCTRYHYFNIMKGYTIVLGTGGSTSCG